MDKIMYKYGKEDAYYKIRLLLSHAGMVEALELLSENEKNILKELNEDD